MSESELMLVHWRQICLTNTHGAGQCRCDRPKGRMAPPPHTCAAQLCHVVATKQVCPVYKTQEKTKPSRNSMGDARPCPQSRRNRGETPAATPQTALCEDQCPESNAVRLINLHCPLTGQSGDNCELMETNPPKQVNGRQAPQAS